MSKCNKVNPFKKLLCQIWTKEKFRTWKKEIITHKKLIFVSIILVIMATILNIISSSYVARVSAVETTDIFLDNIKPINLNFLFSYGYLFLISSFFIYPLFFKVEKLAKTVSHFSLLLATRSFFISLTHLKTPEDAINVSFPGIFNNLVFQNDLFFSGHVAMIFLGFLIFKNSKIKWLFLIGSIVMGITVLLMHQHYTIDVLSAYFITYGTYKIGEKIFKKL